MCGFFSKPSLLHNGKMSETSLTLVDDFNTRGFPNLRSVADFHKPTFNKESLYKTLG